MYIYIYICIYIYIYIYIYTHTHTHSAHVQPCSKRVFKGFKEVKLVFFFVTGYFFSSIS